MIDSGPAPLPPMMVTVDFHNPDKRDVRTELIVRPSLFDRGTIGLLLPKIDKTEVKRASAGVEMTPMAPDDPIGLWYIPGGKPSNPQLPRRWRELDRQKLWMISSTQVSKLGAIPLGPGESLRAVLVLSHKRDVPTSIAPRVSIEQRIGGLSVGGSTFQIGYDGSASPAQIRPRRVRIIANRLEWRGHDGDRHCRFLWLQLTIANDPNRTALRLLGRGRRVGMNGACLFDGYLADGEPLTLELLQTRPGNEPSEGERLYQHRFDGPVGGWLGPHSLRRGKGALMMTFTVADVGEPVHVAAD